MSAVDLLDAAVATAFYGRFHTLREMQEAAIEPLVSGNNVVLSAGTGSGKTEAVVAPLVSRYWRDAAQAGELFLLYIAPTKALVNDLEKRLYGPLYSLGLKVGVRHGDQDDLVSGATPNVLITTPESLDVLLFRHDPAIASIRAVVIDEVHLLYNTQRGLQLSILLKRLQSQLPSSIQWAALSATIGRLSDVREFLFGPSQEAVVLGFPAHREIDAHIRRIANETEFRDLVVRLTEGRPTKLLIFANSRRECERLAGVLHEHESLRHSIFAHYSSLSPEVRVDTERKFSASNTAICIATSTLELGIDIGDIDAVLLWGVPGGVESFLQRAGRANRRASKTNVVCLVPDTSRCPIGNSLQFAALIDAATSGDMPIRSPFELFGAIAQQCLSMIASLGGRYTRIADLFQMVDNHSYLDRPTVESILAELAGNGFLKPHGFKNQYGADEMLHGLVDHQLIYGNFGAGSQTVDMYHGAKCLGAVPATNLLRIQRGDTVRFAGRCWQVEKASRSAITLQPSKAGRGAIDFTYSSGGPRCDAFVCDRMWRILQLGELNEHRLSTAIRGNAGNDFRA
jgi:ATP-dependent Lhr-like helicase